VPSATAGALGLSPRGAAVKRDTRGPDEPASSADLRFDLLALGLSLGEAEGALAVRREAAVELLLLSPHRGGARNRVAEAGGLGEACRPLVVLLAGRCDQLIDRLQPVTGST